MARKGVILAAGLGTRLHPMTLAVNKQLIPVYDKPMIYYAIWVLIKAGVRDIMLVTSGVDKNSFERLLGDGSRFGIHMHYTVQYVPNGLVDAFVQTEDFIAGGPCVLILGDNIFYGSGSPPCSARRPRRRTAPPFSAPTCPIRNVSASLLSTKRAKF